MKSITLKTHKGSSEIRIGKGLLNHLEKTLKSFYPHARFILITTKGLYKIYGKLLRGKLPKALTLTVPDGEGAKSMNTVLGLAEQMVGKNMGRHDVIVGFGGGVVSDMAGFLASIYMRGVPFFMVPTTLLSMVDAAIGGKTAIDFERVKNILGTVYFPRLVLCDTGLLKSLPERELASGLSEIVKYAAVCDPSLFRDLDRDKPDYITIITKCVRAKTKVAQKDTLDVGLRHILNYGHTFGHAIEAKSHYALNHGESIAIGMVISNRIAARLGKQPPEVAEKIEGVLRKFGLPMELPKGMTLRSLCALVTKDKKCVRGIVKFILVPKPGKPEVLKKTPKELIKLAS